jgi:myosin heavy subunit
MADLIEAISETDCSYLKCIRANKTAKARFLDAPYVCEQIKWAGVVETITLCDKGYPVHYSFDSFLHRYSFPADFTLICLPPNNYFMSKFQLWQVGKAR